MKFFKSKQTRDLNVLLSEYPDNVDSFSKEEMKILLEYLNSKMHIIENKYQKLSLSHEKLKSEINYDKIRYLYKTKLNNKI